MIPIVASLQASLVGPLPASVSRYSTALNTASGESTLPQGNVAVP